MIIPLRTLVSLAGALVFACMTPLVLNAQMPHSRIGIFDGFSDIGSPGIPGSVCYHEPGQMVRLSGSGANIWFARDSFSFLWKKMNGDFIVQTRLSWIGTGHEPHRKTGIMIRDSQDASAPMVACTVHGDGLTCLQYRDAGGEDVKEIRFSVNAPDVLQLEKKGNLYTMSAARFGDTYEVQKLENVNLQDNLLAGLFICSHNDEFYEEAEFTNIRIFNTAPDTLVQYRDYLGSLLEILEVESGNRQVLAGSDNSWQAPNWTPDGSALIYNSAGLLYNFDIRTGVSTLLKTGFADRNNNDHVLSFDGRHLGISHHAEESGGESVVYTLPATGGTPARVTAKSPSYLHGWSPDGRFLVYTGEREGEFDIYKIPAEGGREIRLTKSKGLDDGSEYSPDGNSIFFCSSRTGRMQIWRMDPDGKNQRQLTFDDLNNWFPHVSPDNKWIVFLSFPPEVPADQHPFYQRVYLRLMPVTGGEARVIAYLYGGQGSINVPSWSPDSRKISFISNGQFR